MKHRLTLIILTILVLGLIASPTFAYQMPDTAPDSIAQNATGWQAWIYDYSVDSLYRINQNGLQQTLVRPKLTNEQTGNTSAMLTISPDGGYMLISAPLNNGNQGLGIYNLATQTFVATHEAAPNTEIRLGNTSNSHAFSGVVQGLSSQFVAVTYAYSVFGGALPANTPAWTIVIYDLATGAEVNRLESNNANLISNVPTANAEGTFGHVVYMDSTLEVHVQLLPSAAGVPTYTDALVWDTQLGSINASPWTQLDIDILPNPNGAANQAVFPSQLSSYAVLPPIGPYDSMNAIETGFPQSVTPAPTTLWVDGTRHQFSPRWTAGGNLVLFSTFDANGVQGWHVLPVGSNNLNTLPNDTMMVASLPDGFLAQKQNNDIYYYHQSDLINATQVWTAQSTSQIIVWTSPIISSGNSGNAGNGNVGNPVNTISYGQTVTGTVGACGQGEEWRFTGAANDVVEIIMINTDGGLDPLVILNSAAGAFQTQDDDSYGNLDAHIQAYSLPQDGDYIIVADCAGGQGGYELTLNGSAISANPPSGITHLLYGETITAFKDDCAFPDYYSFDGTAGDVVDLSMSVLDGTIDPYLYLYAPNNAPVAENDDSNGTLSSYLSAITLPQTGTYNISASCLTPNGNYEISVFLNGNNANPVPPAANPPSTQNGGMIFYGDTVFGEFTDGDCPTGFLYFFDGLAGDVVTIQMWQETGGVDPLLVLFDPNVNELIQDDDGLGLPNATISSYVLPMDGNYRIGARCFGTDGGTFRLELFTQ